MHYILGGTKVAAPPQKVVKQAPSKYDKPSVVGGDAKYDVAKRGAASNGSGGYMASTFSKTNKEPAAGGAMASVAKSFGTVKSMGKGAAVDAEEVKKLKN